MAILTVGTGGEFSTIASAVSAAQDGDTVQVQAGTYVNDFLTVNSKITLEGVGGMVKLVGTIPSTNGKGMIVVNNDLTLSNFDISGGTDGGQYGNVAGIRYQDGNLTILNSYIHDNQDGLLAGGDNPDKTIIIDHSEFGHNGQTSLTHNIYINNVGTTVLTNSYIHDAYNQGTEFRSRGAKTTIVNNRFVDNNSDANYVIDVPSGGEVLIKDNVIQKSANASNPAIIHWGASQIVPFHAGSSLTVTGNTIINRNTSGSSYLIANQSDVYNPTGIVTVPTVSNNTLYGVSASKISNFAATTSGNTLLAAASANAVSSAHPWTVPTTVWNPAAQPGAMTLTTRNHLVTGNAAALTVMDKVGSNTVVGGTGGLTLISTAQSLDVTTAAGATDTVSVGARSKVHSNGTDQIVVTGNYTTVDVTGQATITAAANGSNTFNFRGNGAVRTAGGDTVNVTGSTVDVVGSGAPVTAKETDGTVTFRQSSGTAPAATTVSGGAATVSGSTNYGNKTVTTSGKASSIRLGEGKQSVVSNGADTIQAGAGQVSVTAAAGATVAGGSGTLWLSASGGTAQVRGGEGAFTFAGGAGGLAFIGGAGTAVIRGGTGTLDVSAGAGNVTLTGSSNGGDAFRGGSGAAVLTLGKGSNTVQFGGGNTTVTGGTGVERYSFGAGSGTGHDLIKNFTLGTDKLDLGGRTISSQSSSSAGLNLVLSDGTSIQFTGIKAFSAAMLA